jgi:hypothetical protein
MIKSFISHHMKELQKIKDQHGTPTTHVGLENKLRNDISELVDQMVFLTQHERTYYTFMFRRVMEAEQLLRRVVVALGSKPRFSFNDRGTRDDSYKLAAEITDYLGG